MEYLDQSLRDVFVDLHCSGLWLDEKAISDSILLAPAEEIRAAYAAARAAGAVDLRAFYDRWFQTVMPGDDAYRTDPAHGPLQHLAAIWPHLTRPPDDPDERSTRFPLPYPYVVVGGRFQEAYYWDSYFTQLGLLRTGQHALVRHMLDNFAHALTTLGFIPNGFRSYFLTRSQPPFFAAMVQDYGRATGEPAAAWARYLPAMTREYAFFMGSERNHGGLARYWDAGAGPRIEMYGTDLEWTDHARTHPGFFRDLRAACESGWDFSSRWLADPMDLGSIRTTRIWPVDLNCLLLRMEECLAEAAEATGARDAAGYRAAADRRRQAIRDRFFDPGRGYFFDLSIDDGICLPVTSAAGLFPLYAGAATEAQAERAVAWMERHLLRAGGLLTTDIDSGQQWDSPNGWAPLQWIAVQGLRRYGYDDLAETLRRRWLTTCDTVFAATGKFVEKYNVLDPTDPSGGGEYELQDGFGWTNGVYLDLATYGGRAGPLPGSRSAEGTRDAHDHGSDRGLFCLYGDTNCWKCQKNCTKDSPYDRAGGRRSMRTRSILAASLIAWSIPVWATGQAADSPAAQDVDTAAAEKIFQRSCRACHGNKAQGAASYPSLSDKDPAYIVERLERYRAGEKIGPNSILMIQHAKKLSDEDITSLSVYVTTAFD